jgi:hypothetical protein
MTVLTTESGQEDALLTPPEVSDILRVPVGTLRQWRHRNTGPRAIRFESGSVRYRRSVVLDWLTAQEQNTRTD